MISLKKFHFDKFSEFILSLTTHNETLSINSYLTLSVNPLGII